MITAITGLTAASIKESTLRGTTALVILTVIGIAACAAPPPPGSREEAVHKAWDEFCRIRYCEGFPGRITEFNDRHIVVSINGNTRYLTYTVAGNPGSYIASVFPSLNSGRTKP